MSRIARRSGQTKEGPVKAWRAALAAAIATAAIALIVIAPLAQSSKRHGGLKVIAVSGGFHEAQAVAKCPKGYVIVGGGFGGVERGSRIGQGRLAALGGEHRRPNDKRAPSINAQAICAKGTGGFQLTDNGRRGWRRGNSASGARHPSRTGARLRRSQHVADRQRGDAQALCITPSRAGWSSAPPSAPPPPRWRTPPRRRSAAAPPASGGRARVAHGRAGARARPREPR